MVKYLALFSFLYAFTLAQTQEEVYFNQYAEDYFLLGMRQYSQKDFKNALQSFRSGIVSYPQNHRISAATVMAAKTYYALKYFDSSLVILDSFLVQFPNSLYKEDALFTRGMCYYNQGNYHSTMEQMIKVASGAQQRLNQVHSRNVIDHIIREFYSVDSTEQLYQQLEKGTLKNLIGLFLAEKQFSLDHQDRTALLIKEVQPDVLDEIYHQRYYRLRARSDKSNVVKVAVLLPLQRSTIEDSRDKRIASDVLDGIQFALREYEGTSTQHISVVLDVRDSERKLEVIQKQLDTISIDKNIIGIIGPLYRDETIHASVIAQQKKIPLITPTATDDGIAQIGDYIFQTNTTNSMKAKLLAQYAVRVLNAQRIAVLGANAPQSNANADSFIVEAKRLGATIISDIRYEPGQSDLRPIMKKLRTIAANASAEFSVSMTGKLNTIEVTRKLLSLGVRSQLIDSMITKNGSINLTQIFGVHAKQIADSLKLATRTVTVPYDSLDLPITSIDYIFCPIASKAEIGIITSHVALFNIKTHILGLSEWFDTNELDMNKRYADGIVIGSEKWIEPSEYTNKIFSRFAQRFGRQPNDNVLFGFDVMTLVLDIFNEGVLTREDLTASLNKVAQFNGIRSTISLQYKRTNTYLNILQYKNGKITKIDSITYQP
jgi:tetratricopeptide (TPR) repeat protein